MIAIIPTILLIMVLNYTFRLQDELEEKPLDLFRDYIKRKIEKAVDINSTNGDGDSKSRVWEVDILSGITFAISKDTADAFMTIINTASKIHGGPWIHPRYRNPATMPTIMAYKIFDLKDSDIFNACHDYLVKLERNCKESDLSKEFIKNPRGIKRYE